jgi:triacylglycerol lipase
MRTRKRIPALEILLAAAMLAVVSPSLESKPAVPVVLVHGFKDTASKMEKIARTLRSEGRSVYSVTLKPSFGQVGIDQLAGQLAGYIDRHFKAGEHLDLVGFSMGGLICRYYVQRLGGLPRVRHLVTIASPHNGTWWAYWLNNPGSIQMRPGSDFLRDLNRDKATLNQIQFSSIWTPLDLMILPASSSHLGVGHETRVWVIAHPLMVWSPRSIRAAADELRR